MLHRQRHGCQAHDRVSIFSIQFNSFTWTTGLYMLLATHSYVALDTILRVQQAQVFSRVSKATVYNYVK